MDNGLKYKVVTYHTVTFTHIIEAPDYVTASRMGRELQGKHIQELHTMIKEIPSNDRETGIVMPISIEEVKES